jgi:diketogulonate reductase-like aldo/keto reductase
LLRADCCLLFGACLVLLLLLLLLQVLIKYGIQRYPDTLVTIPKSSNPSRIAGNFGLFDWELSEEQMSTLVGLDCGFRYFISYLKRPDNE